MSSNSEGRKRKANTAYLSRMKEYDRYRKSEEKRAMKMSGAKYSSDGNHQPGYSTPMRDGPSNAMIEDQYYDGRRWMTYERMRFDDERVDSAKAKSRMLKARLKHQDPHSPESLNRAMSPPRPAELPRSTIAPHGVTDGSFNPTAHLSTLGSTAFASKAMKEILGISQQPPAADFPATGLSSFDQSNASRVLFQPSATFATDHDTGRLTMQHLVDAPKGTPLLQISSASLDPFMTSYSSPMNTSKGPIRAAQNKRLAMSTANIHSLADAPRIYGQAGIAERNHRTYAHGMRPPRPGTSESYQRRSASPRRVRSASPRKHRPTAALSPHRPERFPSFAEQSLVLRSSTAGLNASMHSAEPLSMSKQFGLPPSQFDLTSTVASNPATAAAQSIYFAHYNGLEVSKKLSRATTHHSCDCISYTSHLMRL